MNAKPLYILALALGTQACADKVTGPDDEYDPETHTSQSISVGQPAWPVPTLPPIQTQPTFWTCAAQAEGTFVDAAVQILVLETQALNTQDPFRQAVLFAEVARRKHQAKMALHFALTVCVDTYGPPRLFALPDENGNLVFQPFSVSVYHAYLVEKHLERRS
jgi:hypothetical protein